jgi:nitrogen regulatory protein PII
MVNNIVTITPRQEGGQMKEIRSAAGPFWPEDANTGMKETGLTGKTQAEVIGAGRQQFNDIYECIL